MIRLTLTHRDGQVWIMHEPTQALALNLVATMREIAAAEGVECPQVVIVTSETCLRCGGDGKGHQTCRRLTAAGRAIVTTTPRT